MDAKSGETCFHCHGLLSKGGPVKAVQSHGLKRIHERCYAEWQVECYPITCPQCSGQGKIVTATKEVRECCNGGQPMYGGFAAFAGCEYCPRMVVNQVPSAHKTCDLCEGKGRLRTEPVPITKVVGWKKAT